MAMVRFLCDGKNSTMFILNSRKEIDCVPMVGDIIKTTNEDFTTSSFRIKPFKNKESVWLNFKVILREYSPLFDEWRLICEPLPESLCYLLKNLKVK